MCGEGGLGRIRALHWLTDVPRPYTSVLFRGLSAGLGVPLTVHYRERALATHPWQSSHDAGFSSRVRSAGRALDTELLRIAVRERDALLVVGGWNDATMLSVLVLRRLLGLPYAVFTDTPDETWLVRSKPKAWLRARILRWILGGASRVMGTGRPALELLEAMGTDRERLVNLPYLIEADRYRAREPSRAGDVVHLLSVGQLTQRKDLETALEAFAQLRSEGVDRFRYRLVGAGPDEQSLRARATALGLDGQVEITGWLEGDALVDCFAQGDVLIHPCVFEPYGVVVLEAMAAGLAVVCSDRTFAALDRVVDGESGFIFRTGDAADLASKLRPLIEAPERIDSIGEAARREARAWPASRALEAVRDVLTAANAGLGP
jgi:glycosyltransferase involved in cell wall biosynthesis